MYFFTSINENAGTVHHTCLSVQLFFYIRLLNTIVEKR